jgi:cystathionine gamma-lyase
MTRKIDTIAVHAGQPNDERTGAVTFPIYQTSTYAQLAPGIHKGYSYSRTANPTREALERCIAALEGCRFGLAFASGLSAATACLLLLERGDQVVACKDLYGGSYRLFTSICNRYGIEFSFVDTAAAGALEAALKPDTRLLWLESPSNPLLRVTDMKAACLAAHEQGTRVVVDNTFATPYLQHPAELGADIVLHSTTKYINGHADVIGGALATDDADLAERLRFVQNAVGGVPGPFDCFLTLRGIKTLGPRMDRHCANARKIAAFLQEHPSVAHVYFPGLESHPGHDVAAVQMRDFGGMVSFDLKGDAEDAKRFTTLTQLFTLAESLGSVKSLLCHPASMTHACVAPEVRRENGIGESLIRLSVGIEDAYDLIDDLAQALAKSATRKTGLATGIRAVE